MSNSDKRDCPTCDGEGKVLDMRYRRPARVRCKTCKGEGKLDFGVWPYQPWPVIPASDRLRATLEAGDADARAVMREHRVSVPVLTAEKAGPGTGFVGARVSGPPVTSEADHFYTCAQCGQAVDMRDLGQVFHHEEPGHEPLKLDS